MRDENETDVERKLRQSEREFTSVLNNFLVYVKPICAEFCNTVCYISITYRNICNIDLHLSNNEVCLSGNLL